MYFFVMLKILNIFISFFVLRTQIRHIPISFVYFQARDLLLHKTTTTVTTNKGNLYLSVTPTLSVKYLGRLYIQAAWD